MDHSEVGEIVCLVLTFVGLIALVGCFFEWLFGGDVLVNIITLSIVYLMVGIYGLFWLNPET